MRFLFNTYEKDTTRKHGFTVDESVGERGPVENCALRDGNLAKGIARHIVDRTYTKTKSMQSK